MYIRVMKPKENKNTAATESVTQKKSDGKQSFGFVDNRTKSKQAFQFQPIADKFTVNQQPIQKNEYTTGPQVNLKSGNRNLALKSNVKVSSEVLQKRERNAVVVWNVTHEVLPDDNGSLFGEDSEPFKNEGVELYLNDSVVVDDEDIFQSRRGANQESSKRRSEDKEGHLTNKWLKLIKMERAKVSGKGYIREETVRMGKDVQEKREIEISKVDEKTAKEAGDKIYNAWSYLRKKRRMSVGAWKRWEELRGEKKKETSPSWDQIEEGHDVSMQLSNSAPEGYDNYSVEVDSSQGIFTARDKKSGIPIGIIVIEKRTTTVFPLHNEDDNKKWYLRWLIGHPALKGAGGMLLNEAVNYVKGKEGKAIWVESAPSAMDWYRSKGFKLLRKEKQEEYNSDFEEGWDSLLMILCLE